MIITAIGKTSSQCPPYEIECGFWCCPTGEACVDQRCRASFAVRVMRPGDSKDERQLEPPNELDDSEEEEAFD